MTESKVWMPMSDVNKLDAVVHALGIEDSDTTPAEAVAALHTEIERLRAKVDRLLALPWNLKDRIDRRLNDCLVDMEVGYDDSVEGFNQAWNIVREAFVEALTKPE